MTVSVELNEKKIALSVGKEFQLKAVVLPENADNVLAWTSSNPAVADVTSTGLVRAVSAGEVLITAAAEDGSGKKASCTVIVSAVDPVQWDQTQDQPVQDQTQNRPVQDQTQNQPVQDQIQKDQIQKNDPVQIQYITLDKAYVSMNQSDRIQLIATVFPDNAEQNVDWTSSNPAAAAVNNTGLVTAEGVGQTVITAKGRDGSGKSAVCTINVTKADNQQEDVKENKSESDSGTDRSEKNNNSSLDLPSIPALGVRLTDKKSKTIYKVTKRGAAGGNVTYVQPQNRNVKEVMVPVAVSIDGIRYKVTGISAYAFKNLKQLKTVVIGNHVLNVGEGAFYGCTKLKNVSMGKNIRSIGTKAFYKCTALIRVAVPSKVTRIGTKAFCGNKKLGNINIQTMNLTKKNVGSKAFDEIGPQAVYTVPRSKAEAYKAILILKGADL